MKKKKKQDSLVSGESYTLRIYSNSHLPFSHHQPILLSSCTPLIQCEPFNIQPVHMHRLHQIPLIENLACGFRWAELTRQDPAQMKSWDVWDYMQEICRSFVQKEWTPHSEGAAIIPSVVSDSNQTHSDELQDSSSFICSNEVTFAGGKKEGTKTQTEENNNNNNNNKALEISNEIHFLSRWGGLCRSWALFRKFHSDLMLMLTAVDLKLNLKRMKRCCEKVSAPS